jgi:hypothetical protein
MLKTSEAIRPTRPISFLSRASTQARNYSTLIGWLLYRAFKGRTAKLTLATMFSLGHLAGQAAAIYVVYWYGKQMEKTGIAEVPVLKISVNLKDHPEWLWLVVAVSTTCFVISAGFLYLSRRQVLDIVEDHFARSGEQLVLISLRMPDPRAPLASKLLMDFGVSTLTIGCRRGSMIANSFANAITALVGGFGAAIFLLRTQPPLTLLILVSVGLGALLLYPLTLRAVQAAKDMEKSQAAFKMEVRKLVERRSTEQVATSLETVDETARAWMMRRRVVTELVFATEIGITVLLGIVVYYMASQALAGKEQWAIFIAYIGALRMTLQGAAHVIQSFASVSRYYPQIVRYYLFMKDSQKIDSTPLVRVHCGDEVILGTLHNGRDVVVEVGDCLAVLSDRPVLREAMFAFIDARLARSAEPVAVAAVNIADSQESVAGLALVSFSEVCKDMKQVQGLLEGPLKDKVTLILYQHAEQAGSFGEKYVVTTERRELQRFALRGTQEGDDVLKEFALKAAAKQRASRDLPDDDEEDDDI